MGRTLFDAVWDAHAVRQLPTGQTQLYVGLHLVHEVTSPQAFDMLHARGWSVKAPHRTFATLDHIVPTLGQTRPFADVMAEAMAAALEENCRRHGIPLFTLESGRQGIVHVVGPELGLTQPGMTITCGDSHTSTHGAFGALAFGIGTSQVRDVLASQCVALNKPRLRRIDVTGVLPRGVTAKDVILTIIRTLGVDGGRGFAYEYGGSVIEALSMDARMTLCNMSIEGGAQIGYVNPDQATVEFLRGRPYAPSGQDFETAATRWLSLASDASAKYDDHVVLDGDHMAPTVTWGINPGQSVAVDEPLPNPEALTGRDATGAAEALAFMRLTPDRPLIGQPIQVAFIGSCTNGRLSDLREAASVIRGHKVPSTVRALVVPGSQQVRAAAEAEGLHEIFQEAGFQWRAAGCSMCLAMNDDRLNADEICASSSNRNFKGRQGSPTGRTLLMSPAMVAAAAVSGEIVDVREWT